MNNNVKNESQQLKILRNNLFPGNKFMCEEKLIKTHFAQWLILSFLPNRKFLANKMYSKVEQIASHIAISNKKII